MVARRMLYANFPLRNIENKNVLSEHRATHNDLISVLLLNSSKTISANLAAVKVLAWKPVVIEQAFVYSLKLKPQYRVWQKVILQIEIFTVIERNISRVNKLANTAGCLVAELNQICSNLAQQAWWKIAESGARVDQSHSVLRWDRLFPNFNARNFNLKLMIW